MTSFWLRDCNILPKKELHTSLWVDLMKALGMWLQRTFKLVSLGILDVVLWSNVGSKVRYYTDICICVYYMYLYIYIKICVCQNSKVKVSLYVYIDHVPEGLKILNLTLEQQACIGKPRVRIGLVPRPCWALTTEVSLASAEEEDIFFANIGICRMQESVVGNLS